MQIEIRLIENRLQLTKFQYFQRTLLDFNGTAMISEYKYLKFKIYTPSASELTGFDEPFKRLWPRIMNRMWAFDNNSDFGQEYWDIPRFYIPEEELHQWTDVTLDLSTARDRHNRVVILNIGGEPSPDPSKELVYYLANIRFEKE